MGVADAAASSRETHHQTGNGAATVTDATDATPTAVTITATAVTITATAVTACPIYLFTWCAVSLQMVWGLNISQTDHLPQQTV